MSDYTGMDAERMFGNTSEYTTNVECFKISKQPPPKAEWSMNPDFSFVFLVAHEKPNAFVRFFQKHILGIYWRDHHNK